MFDAENVLESMLETFFQKKMTNDLSFTEDLSVHSLFGQRLDFECE